MPEGNALLDQPFGQVGGQGEPCGSLVLKPVLVEGQGGDHPREGRQEHLQGIDLVEDRLLVFLKVPGIGCGQPLQGGHKTCQITDQTAGLPPGQLCDVGVLFLRHDR